MRTYGPQSNQRQFSRGEFNQVDSWCPATSQHFWKCGLWTTEFNSNFQTARSRHETRTIWLWMSSTRQKDQNDSFRFSPKKSRQKKKLRETLLIWYKYFCNLYCMNVSIINSNPTRSHGSTPNKRHKKKHHQPSTFATAIHHDFFSQNFETGCWNHGCIRFFVCVEPRLLPLICFTWFLSKGKYMGTCGSTSKTRDSSQTHSTVDTQLFRFFLEREGRIRRTLTKRGGECNLQS